MLEPGASSGFSGCFAKKTYLPLFYKILFFQLYRVEREERDRLS